MARTESDQSSDSDDDSVVVFSGHKVVKGPESYNKSEDDRSDKAEE